MNWETLFGSIKQRIQQRPDTEFQQAMIRLAVVSVVMVYFSLGLVHLTPALESQIHFLIPAILFIACVLVGGSIIDLRASVFRRTIGMLHDYAVISYMLILSDEPGFVIAGLYLWVTLGNGFRYGMPFLLASTALSIVGFSCVKYFSTFWNQQPYLWWGTLVTLIAVPAYASTLLKQLQLSINRERLASAAKSSFLANMSHELRTPLNGVIGSAELLTETDLDNNQKDLVRIGHSSAKNLLGLIDNILDITRIESGRFSQIKEDFDLHALVDSIVTMMRGIATQKGLRLNQSVSPDVPFRLHGDGRHLRQILINLLGNAIKFTERGWVDLNIRLASNDPVPSIVFEISDTGVGIPEKSMGRIFDAFSQGDPSITRRFGGTGLGTTIAKNLVELLGGKLNLRSRQGEGTTFWFALPFELQKDGSFRLDASVIVAILANSKTQNLTEKAIEAFGGKTIVVHEAHLLSHDIQLKNNVDVVVVENSRLPVDPCVFIDSYLKDAKKTPPPVIFITTSGASPDNSTLIHAGYASVLRDSVTNEMLFNALHAAIKQPEPGNPAGLKDYFHGIGALRVLVVEDNPVNQKILCGILEHMGHHVCLARNGEEALDKLETELCDLAIIDMHMPEMSGSEIVKRWRFIEQERLPIIMLTADARTDAEAECLEAGADVFLTKPIRSAELAGAIAGLFREKEKPTRSSTETSTTTRPNEILDESILGELSRMSGDDLVREILSSFCKDSEQNLLETQRALFGRNQAKWHDQLHMLKGGAFDIGAWKLAHLCAHTERLHLSDASRSEANQKLDEIRIALSEVQSAIEIHLDRIPITETV